MVQGRPRHNFELGKAFDLAQSNPNLAFAIWQGRGGIIFPVKSSLETKCVQCEVQWEQTEILRYLVNKRFYFYEIYLSSFFQNNKNLSLIFDKITLAIRLQLLSFLVKYTKFDRSFFDKFSQYTYHRLER